jgi:glycosyltransferase involved in cell wall biosynthesis
VGSDNILLKGLTILIPVYNSEESLAELLAGLARVLPTLAAAFEVILVNDGSRDRSWEVVTRLAQEYPWAHGINLMRNYGQHNALLCGIRTAQHDIIVTMDDDLQHPPEEIHKLLAKLAEGLDVVYGVPEAEQHGLWRDLASQVTKLALQSAMGAKTARQVSAFRAFRTQTREAFQSYAGPFLSLDVLLTWATTRFGAVPVRHVPRRHGTSNYTFRKLLVHAVNMMTGFSTMPLQLASLIGFVFTLFGIGVLVYVIGRYLVLGYSVAGFPFLASTIAIFSGAQLFALGIMGEYLARMHFRMMEKPTYVVREQTANSGPAEQPHGR